MAKHALIETATGRVANVIEIDPAATYSPPAGFSVLFNSLCSQANPGDTWSGSAFTPAPQPPPDPLGTEKAALRGFMNDPQIDAVVAADPALLTPAQQIARKEAIAIRSLVRIVRAELAP